MMKILVKIVEGPAANQTFVVEGNSCCIVGRGEEADFRITCDALISRCHFEIAFDGTQITLTDLGSTNGTFVDGIALTKDRPVYLRDGQSFIAGRTSQFVASIIQVAPVVPPLTPSPVPKYSPTSPFFDSREIHVSDLAPRVTPKTDSQLPAVNAAQRENPSQASGNFTESILRDFGSEPRLGNGNDIGPTEQSGLLFSNFSATGSGELFSRGTGADRSFSSSPPPLEPSNERSITSRRTDESQRVDEPNSELYFGSIAPPGVTDDVPRKFAPLEMPPDNSAADLSVAVPPPARPPVPTEVVVERSRDHQGLNEERKFSPDRSTPVHPHSPQARAAGSGSVGMPGQIHDAPDPFDDRRQDPDPTSAKTVRPPGEIGFVVTQRDNGLFFFNGQSASDLPIVLAALEKSYASLFCVDFMRAGIETQPSSQDPAVVDDGKSEPESKKRPSPIGDRPLKTATEKSAPMPADQPHSNFMELDDESDFDHQSPFDGLGTERKDATDRSLSAADATSTSTFKRTGTPLFHWLPTDVQWKHPLLLTPGELDCDISDIWDEDALICMFGSSSKQLIEHCHQLIRTNLRNGKVGDFMFGFCWPSVLSSTLASQPQKVTDRIFAGGVAALLMEDPQQEFPWQIISKIDLTERLRTAGA